MLSIGSLLDRFRGPLADRIRVEEVVMRVVQELCAITLTPKQIQFKANIVSLAISPGAKQAIYIKKEQILEKIKAELPKIPVVDIRWERQTNNLQDTTHNQKNHWVVQHFWVYTEPCRGEKWKIYLPFVALAKEGLCYGSFFTWLIFSYTVVWFQKRTFKKKGSLWKI